MIVRDYEDRHGRQPTLTDRDPTPMPKSWRSGRPPMPSAPSGWSIATFTHAGAVHDVRRRDLFARIRRLYYGAADPKGRGESGVRFFASPTRHHAPEVILRSAKPKPRRCCGVFQGAAVASPSPMGEVGSHRRMIRVRGSDQSIDRTLTNLSPGRGSAPPLPRSRRNRIKP